MLNLLTNAIKYTPPGGSIEVDVAREGDCAIVRVKDTGIGMAPELIPTVFDLFVQGERSLDRSEGGLGIGLTLVKRLVSLHGGTVSAHSDGPGRGSEFAIYASRARAVCIVERASSRPRPSHRRTGAAACPVVDDNRDSADTLAALLEAWGHDVRTLYDGPSASAAVAEFQPNVVLLDIGLPKMNGYEVADTTAPIDESTAR